MKVRGRGDGWRHGGTVGRKDARALGLAALVLPGPGPGLPALLAGLALLVAQYKWAETRLDFVKRAAL